MSNTKSCHGNIYTVKMVIKTKLKGLNGTFLSKFVVWSQQLKHGVNHAQSQQ